LGDIFSIRIAGNFVNEDILGSMEFACKIAGSKILVVLGHSQCGAIKGACDNVSLGNLTALIQKLRPAVSAVTGLPGERCSQNAEFVQAVAQENVHLTVEAILERSPILREMNQNKEIGIVGGLHDIETGQITFFDYR
jgi:carbonic anhydrase